MRTVIAALVAVAVVALAAPASAERPPWNPFCQDPPDLHFCSVLPGQGEPLPAPIPDTDSVNVWVLQAPIWEFEPGLGKITKFIKLIHTAIGLVHNETGKEYSFEFEGIYESPNATFPWIVDDPSVPGGRNLEWCNQGGVCWDATIDWSYYTESQEMIGTINGTIFNQLMKWLPATNETDWITYETFRVMNEWDDGNGDVLFESSTCDDFAFDALGVMMSWGADFDTSIDLKRDFINFYVGDNKIVPVNVSDPTAFTQMVIWYEQYNINQRGADCVAKSGIEKDLCEAETLGAVVEFLENDKYVYLGGKYYWLTQAPKPDGFDWKYSQEKLVPRNNTLA